MENNFIQMAASVGHAVAYTIRQIFKYIIDCVQLLFTNGFTYIVAETLILDRTPQIIVQRCQVIAPRWLNDISFAADNTIFKNRAQNIECSFGWMTRSAVLLKIKINFIWKEGFFFFLPKSASTVSRSVAIFPSVVQAYTQPYISVRLKLIIWQIRHELSATTHEISTSWKKTLDGASYIW